MIQLKQWITLSHRKSRHKWPNSEFTSKPFPSSSGAANKPWISCLYGQTHDELLCNWNVVLGPTLSFRGKIGGKLIICQQNRQSVTGMTFWVTTLYVENRTANLTASFWFKFQILYYKPMIKTWKKPTRLISWEARPRRDLGLSWRSRPWNGLQTAGLIWSDHQATVLQKYSGKRKRNRWVLSLERYSEMLVALLC